MKISCPKCLREYDIKPQRNKKKIAFHCYACQYAWNIYTTPSKKGGKRIFLWIIICMLLIGGSIFYFMPKKIKDSPFLLENIQWYEGKEHTIYVFGEIVNPTISSLPTQPISVVVEAPCAKNTLAKVFQWKYQISVPILTPQERVAFKTSYKLPPHLQVGRVIVSNS